MARARILMPALKAPPLAYAGEREALQRELDELRATLRRNAPGSPNCVAINRKIIRITARLMALGVEPAPVPGSARKDLQ